MEPQLQSSIEFRKRGRRPLNRPEEEKKNMKVEANKKYYLKNQNKLIEQSRAYKDNNREQVNERAKLAYHAKIFLAITP